MIGAAVASTAGQAGLRVEQVEITGLKRMDRMTVYAIALEDKQNRTSMLAVDLPAIRDRLLRYGWIADAHVSRRLPDTLLIDIVERTPAAVWQDRGELTLIDKDGVLLEPVQPNAIPNLPLVIGPGADRQEAGYQALLAAAPQLRPKIKAATWIGKPPLGPDLFERRGAGPARGRGGPGAGALRRAGCQSTAAGAGLDAVRHARPGEAGCAQARHEPEPCTGRSRAGRNGGRAGNRWRGECGGGRWRSRV